MAQFDKVGGQPSKRIYDCFTFFNELKILEMRLDTMADFVDFFVLVESVKTFQGHTKNLVFDENKHKFGRYLDKIVHVVVDDMPDNDDPRVREHHQRRAINRALNTALPNDVIIVSDVDEILRPATLRKIREREGYFLIDMPMYQFYLNAQAINKGWDKVFAYSYRLHQKIPDYSFVRVLQEKTFASFSGDNHRIEEGGWHFTFLGGAEKVREKLNSYAHRGGVLNPLLQEGGAERHLMSGYDLGGAQFTKLVDIDDNFPRYVIDNKESLIAEGYIKRPIDRVAELEKLLTSSEKKRREMISRTRALLGSIELKEQNVLRQKVREHEEYMERNWRLDNWI